MSDTLTVALRDSFGKRRNRRLRQSGHIPAVLYGHGKESVSLSVLETEMSAAIRHGSRMVDLGGELSESAMINEIQWDTFGVDVLHVDFTRVSKDEQVEVQVMVELRGEAPGTKMGGIVEHVGHNVTIACPAGSLPEKLQLKINSLELNGSLTAADLELPANTKLVTPAETVLVQCVEAPVDSDEDEGAGETAEPEIIGRSASDEEGSE